MEIRTRDVLVLIIKIMMGASFIGVPKMGDFLIQQSYALGAYFVAYYIMICLFITLAIFYIGASIIEFIRNITEDF